MGPLVSRSVRQMSGNALSVCERLYVEPQRWADAADVLSVELLENRCFPCVVQPAEVNQLADQCWACARAHRKSSRISFSFSRFFRMMVRSPIIFGAWLFDCGAAQKGVGGGGFARTSQWHWRATATARSAWEPELVTFL